MSKHNFVRIGDLPKIPDHRLLAENHVADWPLQREGLVVANEKSFFGTPVYSVKEGFQCIGWANPPYGGVAPDALCFEKEGESGVYWMHISRNHLLMGISAPVQNEQKPEKTRKSQGNKK